MVTVMELAHGIARANTPERQAKRRQFVDDLMGAVPLHPITPAMALQAKLLDGESQSRGVRIPLADLLIGVTARELEYSVRTSNPRHFDLVPGLSVVRL